MKSGPPTIRASWLPSCCCCCFASKKRVADEERQQPEKASGIPLETQDKQSQEATRSQATRAINSALRLPSPTRSLEPRMINPHSNRPSMDTLDDDFDDLPTYEKVMDGKA